MKAGSWFVACGVALALWLGDVLPALVPAADKAPVQPTANDVQDFVFLGEARPVLVRLHVRVDGKPVQTAWDDFMKNLFAYLDVNGDGVLSKEEVERVPPLERILAGGVSGGRGPGGRGGRGAQTAPSLEDLDTNKDGKVSLDELSAYYRKKGFVPFQLRVEGGQSNPLAGLAALGGGRQGEPSATAVSEAIFALLDTNKDGKLTKEKLAAAPALLLRLDEDEDEIVTARELVPNAAPLDPLAQLAAMAGMGRPQTTENKTLVLVTTPGEPPADLVRRLQERYGPKADKPEEKKLSRKDLGLDEAAFGQLDVNRDGVLDAQELAGFVKRRPDLELLVRLGKIEATQTRVVLVPGVGRPLPLADKTQVKDGMATLDLGLTRLDPRSGGSDQADPFAGFQRQQYLAQFKQADKDNKGYLDEKEGRASRQFGSLFKAMDRDGDGKLSEKEVIAYLDQYQELQSRARSACVTLVLSDQSRGLFDLLDTNRDGRLSVREMRQAPKLLAQLDRKGKGYLTRADLPRSYQLTLRRGPANTGGLNGGAAFVVLYGGAGQYEQEQGPTAGPLWFRKMDRNRDGDVSRKEFLGTDEEFRKIDTDGDGLISLEEAEKADAQFRKEQKQEP